MHTRSAIAQEPIRVAAFRSDTLAKRNNSEGIKKPKERSEKAQQ